MTTPEQVARIEEARRRALRNRLIGEGLLPAQADRWIEAWNAEGAGGLASDPNTAAYWEAAHTWINGRLNEGWRL